MDRRTPTSSSLRTTATYWASTASPAPRPSPTRGLSTSPHDNRPWRATRDREGRARGEQRPGADSCPVGGVEAPEVDGRSLTPCSPKAGGRVAWRAAYRASGHRQGAGARRLDKPRESLHRVGDGKAGVLRSAE